MGHTQVPKLDLKRGLPTTPRSQRALLPESGRRVSLSKTHRNVNRTSKANPAFQNGDSNYNSYSARYTKPTLRIVSATNDQTATVRHTLSSWSHYLQRSDSTNVDEKDITDGKVWTSSREDIPFTSSGIGHDSSFVFMEESATFPEQNDWIRNDTSTELRLNQYNSKYSSNNHSEINKQTRQQARRGKPSRELRSILKYALREYPDELAQLMTDTLVYSDQVSGSSGTYPVRSWLDDEKNTVQVSSSRRLNLPLIQSGASRNPGAGTKAADLIDIQDTEQIDEATGPLVFWRPGVEANSPRLKKLFQSKQRNMSQSDTQHRHPSEKSRHNTHVGSRLDTRKKNQKLDPHESTQVIASSFLEPPQEKDHLSKYQTSAQDTLIRTSAKSYHDHRTSSPRKMEVVSAGTSQSPRRYIRHHMYKNLYERFGLQRRPSFEDTTLGNPPPVSDLTLLPPKLSRVALRTNPSSSRISKMSSRSLRSNTNSQPEHISSTMSRLSRSRLGRRRSVRAIASEGHHERSQTSLSAAKELHMNSHIPSDVAYLRPSTSQRLTRSAMALRSPSSRSNPPSYNQMESKQDSSSGRYTNVPPSPPARPKPPGRKTSNKVSEAPKLLLRDHLKRTTFYRRDKAGIKSIVIEPEFFPQPFGPAWLSSAR